MLLGICVSRVGEHISLGTHITRDMCFLGRRRQIPSDMCFPVWETHIPSDKCSPTRETHILSDMCSLTSETHVTRDMCFLGRGTQIPSDMCSPTLTGSGQLSSLGAGLVETLGKIAFIREKKLSKYKFVSVKAYKNLESLTFD